MTTRPTTRRPTGFVSIGYLATKALLLLEYSAVRRGGAEPVQAQEIAGQQLKWLLSRWT